MVNCLFKRVIVFARNFGLEIPIWKNFSLASKFSKKVSPFVTSKLTIMTSWPFFVSKSAIVRSCRSRPPITPLNSLVTSAIRITKSYRIISLFRKISPKIQTSRFNEIDQGKMVSSISCRILLGMFRQLIQSESVFVLSFLY